MRLAITQSNYLPWVGYFKLISKVDTFIFYDSVQYTKNDWRNRNKIIINKSLINLTIPIKYSFSSRYTIDQIRLPESNWRGEHLRLIYQAYSKTNFFSYYSEIEKIIKTDFEFLSKLNIELISYFCSILNISTHIDKSARFDHNLEKTDRIIDKCKDLGADTYVTSPKAMDYLDLKKFKKEKISIELIDYSSCLKLYDQNLLDFIPHVSLLDILFREGPKETSLRLNDVR
jgi:hypothetical protein